MLFPTTRRVIAVLLLGSCAALASANDELAQAIQRDYDSYLGELFDHFHRNPELSFMERSTAARLAAELREVGFEVTEGVGGTGVIAIMKNGPGPTVMMRADMDGLPVQERSGLANASTARQIDWDGNEVPVMHACGHDVQSPAWWVQLGRWQRGETSGREHLCCLASPLKSV